MKSISREFSSPGKERQSCQGRSSSKWWRKATATCFSGQQNVAVLGRRGHVYAFILGSVGQKMEIVLSYHWEPETCSPLHLPFHLTRSTRWDAKWAWCKMLTLILLIAPLKILSCVSEASRQTVQAGLPLLHKLLCSASPFPLHFPRWSV